MNRRLLLGNLAGAALGVARADWLGFRGPGGNGVFSGKGMPLEWSDTRNIAWKTGIPGRGHSSPVIAGDRIYLTTSVEGDVIPGHKAVKHKLEGQEFVHPQTAAEDRHVTLKVLAVDRASGKLLWSRDVYSGGVYDGRHQFNTYASPTPVSDGTNIYCSFEAQGLYAFDRNGKPLWKTSIGGVAKLGLGAGTSPVIAGGVLVLVADDDNGENSHIYGISRSNGEVLWKTKRAASVTWSSPIVVRDGNRELVVAQATENVIAYDPKTGKEVWKAPGIEGYAAASPVSSTGLVFANAYHPVKKVLAIRTDPAAKERVAWSFDKGTAYIPSPIAYGDLLYLMASNGALTALEAATGKIVYEGKRVPKPGRYTASPVAFDGHLLLTSEEGDTHVIRAGREHEVLHSNPLGEPVYASLALDGDSVFIRGSQHLYRISAAAPR
ncbi:MAG: PQQ-binding-like beta-propeller repeat protein [Bryobacterales bacterium]|nr:PQQ-binding-like beta-propeller repeat protein [Bryobacterales bacterium]